MKNTLYVVVGLIVLVALVVLLPVATIWSLNTLFPALAIPLTWKTWLATVVLSSLVSGQYAIRFKK